MAPSTSAFRHCRCNNINAVKENVKKLEDDHKHAKLLAVGLNEIQGLHVDISAVETNIVYVNICKDSSTNAAKLCKKLDEHGILVMPDDDYKVRIVIHHQITVNDVEYTLSCIQKAVTGALSEHVG